jgi:hypothetical protein
VGVLLLGLAGSAACRRGISLAQAMQQMQGAVFRMTLEDEHPIAHEFDVR